jgi:hypothetical protein
MLVVGAGDLLVGAGDDEVRRVHGDQVGGELGGEVVLGVVVLPVEIRVEVLGLLQGVGDVALGDVHARREQRGHQVAVGVVADDQIRPPAQIRQDGAFHLVGEAFQVGPDLEAGDPLGDDLPVVASERHPQDARALGAGDGLLGLVAGGAPGLGMRRVTTRMRGSISRPCSASRSRISRSSARTWSRM